MSAIAYLDGYIINPKAPRVTNKGNAIQSFGLSVYTSPSATNSADKYSIFNCVAFGNVADQVAKDFNEGKTYAHIQAAPRVEKYVDSTGVERKTVSFWVNKASCYKVNKPSDDLDYNRPLKREYKREQDFSDSEL